MCQAYDGEYRAVVAGENFAARLGFAAALAGHSSVAPWPYTGDGDWQHGYDCFAARILPWGVESALHGDGRAAARLLFQTTGKLTPELTALLKT